ncbi:MAG: hypothetical protein M1818_005620 [Claussenomyces sp. TS43310]|nr:MAG: hypothetical protein M1818_005620 [Claussenomyces sp. TS43310]
MSRNTSQANCLDPLDALIDFSGGEYEAMSFRSPSISLMPKPQFVRPRSSSTPNANNAMLPSSPQNMSGPSHQYDLYKQQTGIPAGALASTLAMNQFSAYDSSYLSSLSPAEDFNDYQPLPSQSQTSGFELEMEFDSPTTEPAFFYPEQGGSSSEFVNPSAIQEASAVSAAATTSTQTSNVGRLWPGMHKQQAAMAKAQQQQRQQQQLIQKQRQNSVAPKPQRPKHQAADPIVEEKISQLLNSMRQSSVATSEDDDAATPHGGMSHAQRARKEEEDMDEDERLLASEEGKKLSSKERRQLRNKVSARAFRSRRKEYIGQLEGEIAVKVNENSDLRSQNKALMEENTRLSDLTRMLLSSPSFSNFLDTLSANPTAVAPQQQAPAEQRPVENQQIRKDVNPYERQSNQNHQMHMAILPEHNMDFSMLDMTNEGTFTYTQPQVFSVLELPEAPVDISVLSGKPSDCVGQAFESEKIELPMVSCIPVIEQPVAEPVAEPTNIDDEEFDADPTFALFFDAPVSASPTSQSQIELALTPVFGGIAPEKSLARLDLVDAVDHDSICSAALSRVERLCASLEDITVRLEAMTVNY